uniref:NB-ARC domain-containing protein n=1 Tax=Setaria italica TaxID=4555 RepID=K3ZR31_SETIT
MRWMKRVFGDHHPHGQGLRVLFVLSRPAVEGGLSPRDNFSAKELGRRAYSHPLAVEKFESRVCIDANIYTQRKERLHRLLDGLLPNSPAGGADLLSLSEAELESKIQQHLRGRKFLIVLNDPHDDSAWEHIRQALPAPSDGFSDGSAVIVTPSMEHQEDRADGWITARMLFSHYPGTLPYKVYVCSLDTEALRKKVSELCDPNLAGTVSKVLMKCRSDSFSTKMVFHALHADPHRSKGEWEKLLSSLDDFSTVSNARHIIRFSYDGLPSSYKSCLLYLRIFPPDCKIRRTSLVRRWAAERLITKRGGISAIDEADHCFQELIDRRLVLPGDINPQGKAKSCTVHVPVLSFIARITGDDDPAASNSDLVPELAHHLSIRNGIQLSRMKRKATRSNNCWRILNPSSTTHLKNICNKIFQLKYLSLRNTDVNELPKEINKLQDLETFDIRQTKIHAFPAKAIILRKLVCLLAGRIGPQGKGAMGSGEESFSTLQRLSHVEVSETADVDALNNVGRLQKLKKLGIVINGKQDFLDCLLQVIGKLNEVICSFSICIKDGTEITEMKSSKLPTPRSLAKLNISGKISGLSTWISELEQLSKITLSHTFLEDIDIRILGNLFNLRFLRLGSESYTDKNLTFRNGFSKLEVLVIESSHISDIHFEQKAAPKLEKIVWTSTVNCKIETLAIEKLPSLKEIELNGVCERSRVEKSVRENPKNPKLKYNTDPMCEDTSAME